MKWTQVFVEAFESLASNRLRTGLTMLGIVIGVAATIAMLSVGRGAEAEITTSIEGIGTNLLFAFPGGSEDVTHPQPLTLGDAEAVADPFLAPSVARVAPILQGNGEVTYSGERIISSVVGVTPDYTTVRTWNVTEGEFINDGHLIGRSSVAVLGSEVAEDLFGRRDGITGEIIRIEGQPFRVIGVLEEKGGGPFGSQDARLLIPMTTAQVRVLRRNPADEIDLLLIQAISPEAVTSASLEVGDILRARHNTEIGQDDFSVFNQRDFLQTVATITGVLTIFLGGVAGISLLVGGIGIMNIMLVSVTERTREIGLRKAVGARKGDILLQFLAESVVLSSIGGGLGILLGWGVAELVRVIAAYYETAINPIVGADTVMMATVFSAAVGVFFGWYPAYRAANLEPVEALRFE
ncbi:MAG: FtsX-like permease family protein [Anaerolineae bacterium]|nr:MAG: FtsX-like permease family protein [Anaerolineae bacterium]